MGKHSRSGHGGGSISAVDQATKLVKEVTAAAESVLAIHVSSELSPEQAAPYEQIRATLHQLENLDLAGKVAAVEQEITDGRAALQQEVVDTRERVTAELAEQVRLYHWYREKANNMGIFADMVETEERLAVATTALAEKEQLLAGLEKQVEQLAGVSAELESKSADLAAVEARLAEVRAAIRAMQA